MLPAALTSVWEQVSVSSCKAAYSSKVCVLEGVRKAWFPGERRVSLAWVCDSNGHQASFQAERKGTVKRGVGHHKEVMKTIHPSPDVSGMRERKRGFEVWMPSLNCVKGSHGRGSSPSFSLSVLIYFFNSRVSLLLCASWRVLMKFS